MALTPKLDIRQSQSLLMTPQLRQAINLLQMSNLELGELVEKELESNPLLERENDRISDADTSEQNIDNYDDDKPSVEHEQDNEYDGQFDDYGSDREGYEGETDFSWQDYASSKSHSDDEFDFFANKAREDKSFHTLLSEQISLIFTSSKDKIIAFHLCEYLDESGYFRGNCSEIAKKLNTKVENIKNILGKMKGFEPSGIFAEDLKDCLSIQLKDLNRFDPVIEKLLNNLELLANRDFKELKKICAVDDEDLLEMIQDIKSLNPKPAAEYSQLSTSYIIPDVFVRTNKQGDYLLELNSMSLPRVLINHQYYSEIKEVSEKNKEAKRYLKDQMSTASFLIKALHQRATTILRVSEEIVKNQKSFLEKGIDHLKPMLLRDIAESIEMHESTVSRVTNNKYISTPRGTFELKYFFSIKAGTYTGDETTSTTSIKHKIQKLINEEAEDNILSDDKLVEEMAKLGIKIARRTVAKYRESMNIPTSAERKRSKRNSL